MALIGTVLGAYLTKKIADAWFFRLIQIGLFLISIKLMADAISAIDKQSPDHARSLLDRLVERQPDWAEVYYKQAVVALMTSRPNDAIAHLGETLRREPRHFAAMSLFGQVCLDLDRLHEARFALQRALHQNPHLKGLKEAISSISQQFDARNNHLNA